MKRLLTTACLLGCTAPGISIAEPPVDTSLRAETFDGNLRHLHDPTRAARVEILADSLANTRDEVDLVCVTALAGDAERQKILERVKQRFPYVGFVKTDATMPLDDPRDIHGVAVTPVMTAACTDPADVAILDAHVKCAREVCVDGKGALDVACYFEKCRDRGNATAVRCNVCRVYAFAFSPVDRVRQVCAEAPRGELGFGGQLANVILSRRPLSNVRAHLFPSSIWTHGAISARVEGHKPLNVVCNDIQQWGGGWDYTGPYAPNTPDGWGLEAVLAKLRAIELARTLGRQAPTIVLGGTTLLFTTKRSALLLGEQDWFGVNLTAVVEPTLGLCTTCTTTNPTTTPYFAKGQDDFDLLLFTSGGPITASDVTLERTEAIHTLSGAPVSASAKYGVSARFSW